MDKKVYIVRLLKQFLHVKFLKRPYASYEVYFLCEVVLKRESCHITVYSNVFGGPNISMVPLNALYVTNV
jgi:hypothetical protein